MKDKFWDYFREGDYDKALEVINEHKKFNTDGEISKQTLNERDYIEIIRNNNYRGRELEKEGKIDEAIKVYEENLDLECPVQDPYVALVIIYHRKYDFENEKRVCELALKNVEEEYYNFEENLANVEQFLNTGIWKFDCLPFDPKPLENDIKEAKRIIKSENKDEGVELLENIMANGTFNNTVYNTLYRIYRKDKKYDDAIRVCKNAVEVLGFFSDDRKLKWILNLKKIIQEIDDEKKRVIRNKRKEEKKRHDKILSNIRNNYAESGELEKVGEVDEAVKLDIIRNNDVESVELEEVVDIDEAVKLDIIRNNDVEGRELEKVGEIDEAIKVYEKNLELGSHISHTYISLVGLYHSKYDFENEKRVCELALQNADHDHFYFEETLENVEHFLNTGEWKFDCLPSDSEQIFNLIKEAKTLLKSKNKEKGVMMLEEIITNGTFDYTVYDLLYRSYMKDKKYDDAIRVCEKAVEVLGFFSKNLRELWEKLLEKLIKEKEKNEY